MASAVSEEVKEKIVAVLAVIVVIIAVVQLMPTLQSSLDTANMPILSYALIAALIAIGLVLFAVDSFL